MPAVRRPGTRRPGPLLLAGIALVAATSACSSAGAGPAHGPAHDGAAPSAHVHGIDVNPADGRVYLATHEGLFRYDDAGPVRVGPRIDLMGFAVAGPDHFYASGHPGEGAGLPDPVGLIETKDAGRTWTPLSRQGKSDFHALAASAAGLIGYDGTLRLSADGERWQESTAAVRPYGLAAAPDGRTIVATAEPGPMRSVDGGRTWAPVAAAPPLMVVNWAAADTVAGVSPDGAVAVSTDAGATWSIRGNVGARPQAAGAATAKDGALRLLVATGDRVLESTDGGVTFTEFPRDGA